MVHPPEESLTLAKRRQMTREHASATQLLVSRERLSPSPRPGPQAAWGTVSLLLGQEKNKRTVGCTTGCIIWLSGRSICAAAMKGILVTGPGDGRGAESGQSQPGGPSRFPARRASFRVLPTLLHGRSLNNVIRANVGNENDEKAEKEPETLSQTPRGSSFRSASFRGTSRSASLLHSEGAADDNADGGGQTAKAAAPVLTGVSALYCMQRVCAVAQVTVIEH